MKKCIMRKKNIKDNNILKWNYIGQYVQELKECLEDMEKCH